MWKGIWGVEKGTLLVEEGTCRLKTIHLDESEMHMGPRRVNKASWELERHTHCWKGHVWRLEKNMAYGDVEKGTVVVEEGTCGLKRIHFS